MAHKRKFTEAAAAYVKKLFRGQAVLDGTKSEEGDELPKLGTILEDSSRSAEACPDAPSPDAPSSALKTAGKPKMLKMDVRRKDVSLNDLWELLLQFLKTFEAFSSDLKKRQIIQLAMANTDAFAFEFSEKEVSLKNEDQCHSLLVEMLVAFREEDMYKFSPDRSQFLDASDKGFADEEGKRCFRERLDAALEALLVQPPCKSVKADAGVLSYPEIYCDLERFTYAMNHVHLHTFGYKEQVEAPTHRSKDHCSDLLRKILMTFNSGGTFEVPQNAYVEAGSARKDFDADSKAEFVRKLEQALFNLLGEAADKMQTGPKVTLSLGEAADKM